MSTKDTKTFSTVVLLHQFLTVELSLFRRWRYQMRRSHQLLYTGLLELINGIQEIWLLDIDGLRHAHL